jgi:hypothetical protein
MIKKLLIIFFYFSLCFAQKFELKEFELERIKSTFSIIPKDITTLYLVIKIDNNQEKIWIEKEKCKIRIETGREIFLFNGEKAIEFDPETRVGKSIYSSGVVIGKIQSILDNLFSESKGKKEVGREKIDDKLCTIFKTEKEEVSASEKSSTKTIIKEWFWKNKKIVLKKETEIIATRKVPNISLEDMLKRNIPRTNELKTVTNSYKTIWQVTEIDINKPIDNSLFSIPKDIKYEKINLPRPLKTKPIKMKGAK